MVTTNLPKSEIAVVFVFSSLCLFYFYSYFFVVVVFPLSDCLEYSQDALGWVGKEDKRTKQK